MTNLFRRMKLRGFTLIELLVVIAIIGILVSITMPSYRHYIAKARFTEVMMAVTPYKIAIALALQSGDLMQNLNLGTYGIPDALPPTKNLSDIQVKSGIIKAEGTQAAGDYTYILTPDAEGTHWTIDGTCVAAGICKS